LPASISNDSKAKQWGMRRFKIFIWTKLAFVIVAPIFTGWSLDAADGVIQDAAIHIEDTQVDDTLPEIKELKGI